MSIAKNKVRVMITVSRDERDLWKRVAKAENRPLSNLIVFAMRRYLRNHPLASEGVTARIRRVTGGRRMAAK